MPFARRVEILPPQRSNSGHATFSAPQISHETMIVEVGTDQTLELFCHGRQTDRLMVLRGAIDLMVRQEGPLRRIRLREDEATWVRIPPGLPHEAINLGSTPAASTGRDQFRSLCSGTGRDSRLGKTL